MVELIIYALEIFIYKVSFLQSVKSLLCKRKTNRGVYRTQRTAQFASYLRSFLPFYFNLNRMSDKSKVLLLLFVSFRYQQRAALKFGKMALENMNAVGKVLWQVFCERDGHTRVSHVVNMFTVDLII